MIPAELRARWDRETDRREVLFLADHGGGWPEALSAPGLTPEERIDVLRGLGFRVKERYEMPNDKDTYSPPWPWVRLTNGVGVCLQDGFVSRKGRPVRRGGDRCG